MVSAWAWTRAPLARKLMLYQWAKETIQIVCLRFCLSRHAHSCFGGFFSRVLAHFLQFSYSNHFHLMMKESPSLNIMELPGLSLNCPQCKKRCSAWHKNTNILLFFLKIVILGLYVGKSRNLIGLMIFHGDHVFFISIKNPLTYQITRFSP
jgi:hypothetical protein